MRGPAEQQAGNGAGGVGGKFNRCGWQARYRVAAARGRERVRVDDRLAPIELFPNGPEPFVPHEGLGLHRP